MMRESSFAEAICGSGNGVAIVANKYSNIRAVVCWNEEIAKLARRHNNANVLSLPARFISLEDSLHLVRIFFTTGFEGGRHEIRVKKIPVQI
jgi:ribose 5-phosphate isomerase B